MMNLSSFSEDDPGMNKDVDLTTPQNLVATLEPYSPSPGHQGVNTGGVNVNLRVLYCTNISENADFDSVHQYMKQFGHVERIKMKLIKNPTSYDCHVTFSKAEFASKALDHVNGQTFLDTVCYAKLFSIKNLIDDETDYVPSMFEGICNEEHVKDDPILLWHVANYKPGKENFLMACNCIQKKVGAIPKGNLKRYGKGILIKPVMRFR